MSAEIAAAHWHIPLPIESVLKVNVDEVSTFSHRAAMLTQDENIVEVELTVQSRIKMRRIICFNIKHLTHVE